MSKKIIFILLINIIIFLFIEIAIRTTLGILNYPTVYKLGNIGDNRYDYLTGYYNIPNQPSSYKFKKDGLKKTFRQATDKYGFNLDGMRNSSKDLTLKDDGVFRIFLLGGSTVQGAYLLDRHDPISARLEKKLNNNLKDLNLLFEVINAGTTSFMSSQELALIQNKILYAMNPDYIIIFNGTNDAAFSLGNEFHLSNSHFYQRGFQKNFNKSSKNFLYFFDNWLSKNLSTYFFIKKSIEKLTGIYLFDSDERKLQENKNNFEILNKKVRRYFYNMNILSKISSKETFISYYFQPQMLPKNYSSLSKNNKKIYDEHNESQKFYFRDKQLFYNEVIKKIKKLNSSDEFKKKEYFQLVDISKLLDNSKNLKDFYSDHVHYTTASREIIADRISQDIAKNIRERIFR